MIRYHHCSVQFPSVSWFTYRSLQGFRTRLPHLRHKWNSVVAVAGKPDTFAEVGIVGMGRTEGEEYADDLVEEQAVD